MQRRVLGGLVLLVGGFGSGLFCELRGGQTWSEARGASGAAVPDFSGSAKQRKGLFERLVKDTLAWEAFDPKKNASLELDFAADAAGLRRDFLTADNERSLYYALIRFSGLRCNGGLSVEILEDGLRITRDTYETPVRFSLDSRSAPDYRIFISDHDVDIKRKLSTVSPRGTKVEIGDILLEVQGEPVERYLERMRPYLCYSSIQQLWVEFARYASQRRHDLDLGSFANDVMLKMEKPNGKKYRLKLPYIDDISSIQWMQGDEARRYPSFDVALRTDSFVLHRPGLGQDPGLFILEGILFGEDTPEDLIRLEQWVEEQGAWPSKIILDLTDASGSEVPWALLRLLISEPIPVTQSTLRLGPLTERFVAETRLRASPELKDWLDLVVPEAVAQGAEFTAPIPFRYEPPDLNEEGLMPPAKKHFEGPHVLLVGQSGSLAVNHLAAMWIDDELGASVGLAPLGNGNGWEWYEKIKLPREDRPLVGFSWNIGHVLRPNGELLDGTPLQPRHIVPLGPETSRDWRSQVLMKALNLLKDE